MKKEPQKISAQIQEIDACLNFDEPINVVVVMPNEAEYTIHDVTQMRVFSVHNGCFGFRIDQNDGSVTIVPPGYSIINFLPKS